MCACVGHRTYVSYMYLESTTNNAIVQTFIGLLQQSIRMRHRYRQRRWAWLLHETPRIYGMTSSTPDSLSVTSTESLHSSTNPSQGKVQFDTFPWLDVVVCCCCFLLLFFFVFCCCFCVCAAMHLPSGRRSRLARNRWYVAFTLVRNPGLRSHAGSHILSS